MDGGEIRFDSPGRYLITTKEEINPEIFELYNAKKSRSSLTGGSMEGSKAVIDIKDQSELLSFLNILYNSHHTILKVELLSDRMAKS